MPGPLPKDPAIRQHRIKKTTRATLVASEPLPDKIPPLPKHPNGDSWHAMTRRFWKDIGESPMVAEYLLADMHGLFRLAVLVDLFWKEPSVKLSSEIRLMGQLFGLSPIDRRRLEWQVVSTEDAKNKHHSRRSKQAITVSDETDPRDILNQ